MHIKILGTAAGGGFPQWNCNCRFCGAARNGDDQSGINPRLHASLAVSSSGSSWYLLNATPDVRFQIEQNSELAPGPGVRETPLTGVLLTDAELDHTIGLLMLREGSALTIYGSDAVIGALGSSFPVSTMLAPYAGFEWQKVVCSESFEIDEGQISVTPVHLDDRPPKYVSGGNSQEARNGESWVVAYKLEDTASGAKVLVAPQVSRLDGKLVDELCDTDVVFLDGTCSYDDDMQRQKIESSGSRAMGHLPLFDKGGIIPSIGEIRERRSKDGKNPLKIVLLHINNTNPLLDPASTEAKALSLYGIALGVEGDLIVL